MNLNSGDILLGKYRIERVLGRGGMGVVVAATHLQLGERVALKFLLPEALHSAEAVERFVREARAAVRIKSEHVAAVWDVGTLENGAPYIVMEYLEGEDLADWLTQRGALPIEQAVELVLQACEAIAEAHALGIVHRDLKPANLFVIRRADGLFAVKVLDFGISKASGGMAAQASVTKTTAVMGSPLYMSPEQMQSARSVDARGDIWALGVVLYELLTGRAPFDGQTMSQLVFQVMNAKAPPPTSIRAEIPAGLEAVILRCMEKDRNARYPTVGALAEALLEFGPWRARTSVERITGIMRNAGLALDAPQPAMPAVATELPTPEVAPGTIAPWGQTASPTHKRTTRWVIASGIGVLVVGAVVLAKRVALPTLHAEASTSSALPLATANASSVAAPAASATNNEGAPTPSSAIPLNSALAATPAPSASVRSAALQTPRAPAPRAQPAAQPGKPGLPASAAFPAVTPQPTTTPAAKKNPLNMPMQ